MAFNIAFLITFWILVRMEATSDQEIDNPCLKRLTD